MRCLWKTLFIVGGLFLLAACDNSERANQAIEPMAKAQSEDELLLQIKAAGVLKVITRNAPTTYFIGRDVMPRGPEFDMADSFASFLGVELEVVEKNSIQAVISALKNKEGHIAAAGLTQTKSRAAEFMFGPSYQDITQQVVCRRDNVQPESIEELIGLDIMVAAGTAYS